MDLTSMQQTVMDSESACGVIQPPLEAPTSDPHFESPSSSPMADDLDQLTQQAAVALTYDELFPALPSSTENSQAASAVLPAGPAVSASAGWGAVARSNNDAMRIRSSVITQVFQVRKEERAKLLDSNSQFGESASSSICTEITKKTGAHIEISSAKDHSLTFLVTGKKDEVLKARKLILEKFQAQNRQIIKVPKETHKFLLGKKGKKLQELERLTKTKIQVPNQSSPSEEVTIIGPKDCIEQAIGEINNICNEQNETIEVKKFYHPFICGANNAIVSEFMAEFGVRINVPPLGVQKNEISIAGDKDAVNKAKEKIRKIVEDLDRTCQFVSVEVPKAQHKYVIGHRGCNIAEILDRHNVSVEMPSQDSEVGTITLRGPQDKLGAALTMVYEFAYSNVKMAVEAPEWLHRYIIGRKGANINKITSEHPAVHVEFTDNSETIHLEGPKEDVHKAKKELEEMIKEMTSRLTQSQLKIDPKYHKHIIGKAGANINRIRSEKDVIINIEANGSNIVKLEGPHQAVDLVKKELEDQVRKMENEKEKDISIENRLHRNIIGTKGEKIREIREMFNQVQISFPEQGNKSDIVKIRGPKEDVDACYKYMQRVVRELLENNYQVKLPIFKQYIKFIIGKNGANIKKIREDTSTRIDLPGNDDGGDEITITGCKENCEKAKKLIQKIQDEVANMMEIDIIVPSKFHNSIIGQRGRLIRSISEECGGVAIKFPPADKKSDKVTIRGPKEDVLKAKKILVELSNEKQEASFTAEVRCKEQHHKFLIGKSGATVKKLRDSTGCRIIFPSDKDEDRETITIIGKKEQVQAAQKSLENTIKELNNIVESSVIVPMKHHLYFIRRGGKVVREISDRYGGVTISFPRNGVNSDVVCVKGGVECVAGAKCRILELVNELESQVTKEVVIAQRHHRTVMGPRGSSVQAIIAQHNVEVKFPERASPEEMRGRDEQLECEGEVRSCDIVRVKGPKEACEAAAEALLALVPITKELTVPFKYHRFIIGQRGQNVRELMTNYDVNIQIPPAADNSDVIRVTGLSSNVDSALAALKEQYKKLEEEELDKAARSFTLTLCIDPDFHSKIIGRKGLVVSKIRSKYDVNIKFPQRTDPDPTKITITGYESNCILAKQAIEEITTDLANMIKLSVDIDNRVHARLIGQRGKAIRKIMDEFKVSISFPRDEENPDTVTITGSLESAEGCKAHLLNLAEEYLQDIMDREEMKDYSASRRQPLSFADTFSGSAWAASEDSWVGDNVEDQIAEHTTLPPPPRQPTLNGSLSNGFKKKEGFVVSGAPWTQEAPNVNSSKDFPSMGSMSPSTAPTLTAWGPKR